VVTTDKRGGLGMHYTSVPNIMKVISPLFLDELQEEYQKAKGNVKLLNALIQRISNIKVFDPACGSGNFLIIAYKKLRELEIQILNDLTELKGNKGSGTLDFVSFNSLISLNNFFGIEIDDFAHEIARLSLWLAEHQMNQAFRKEFGHSRPALPLKDSGKIVHANACRIDWEEVCPKEEGDEIYILGNPPYLGSSMQDDNQKEDMEIVLGHFEYFKKQDYISIWFYKAAKFINSKSKYAFVSTNSVNQGVQVSMTWPQIFDLDIEIFYAYKDFKWSNNAKNKAGVICSIIGLRKTSFDAKYLYQHGTRVKVKNINAYLIDGSNIIIESRNKSISNFPKILSGNKPLDGGNLILSREEYDSLVLKEPNLKVFLRKFIGSSEYIKGDFRWCLWLKDYELEDLQSFSTITDKLNRVSVFRSNGGNNAKNKAHVPHKFEFSNEPQFSQIIIPRVSSVRRKYIPMGYLDTDIVVSDSAQVIYDAPIYLLSIICSIFHMIWVKTTSGKLKDDYRYSSYLSYYTFPFPKISKEKEKELEECAYQILETRERYPEKTLAQLYDPDKMPDDLREAHRLNDLAVESCYRAKPFESDEERLEHLFKLYEKMIAAEKKK